MILIFLRIVLWLPLLVISSTLFAQKAISNTIEEMPSPEQLTVEVKEPIQTLLLIIGCGRSGTKYMSKVLFASGLDIQHERMGQHGSVSWLMTPAEAESAPWGPISKDYQFGHILHQVRDPVKVIQSYYNLRPWATWVWISRFVPEIEPADSTLTKCAKYWYYWNLIAEARAELTYRIEDFDADYQIVGDQIGMNFDRATISEIPKNTNTIRDPSHRTITWQVLKAELDPELYEKVRDLALRYGYTVEVTTEA